MKQPCGGVVCGTTFRFSHAIMKQHASRCVELLVLDHFPHQLSATGSTNHPQFPENLLV